MKITKEQLKQIIKEELNQITEGHPGMNPEEMDVMVRGTQGYKDIQPDIARQELDLEDHDLDDIASRLELAGFEQAADFVRQMLSPDMPDNF